MSLFQKLINKIHKNYPITYRFDNLDWNVKVWITKLCDIIDEKPEIKFEKNTGRF